MPSIRHAPPILDAFFSMFKLEHKFFVHIPSMAILPNSKVPSRILQR